MMNKFNPKSYFPSFTAFNFQKKKKGLSEWRQKMDLLKMREEITKKGKYLWISIDSEGRGLTYTKAKYGELVHGT
jgi:hypothetical protein